MIRKLIISLILLVSGSLALVLYDLLPVLSQGEKNKIPYDKITPGIPILMYHKICPDSWGNGPGLRVTPTEFEHQLNYLHKSGYWTISLGQLTDHWNKGTPLPERPLVITFDDGYEDNYTYAFPLLRKYGYTATIFLVYNQVGGYNQWDVRERQSRPLKLLTWEQIRSMQEHGIHFESHTNSHPHLTKLSRDEALKELDESKRMLEKNLGKPVEYIAYPYGQHNDQICDISREVGYKAGISTIFGTNTKDTDRYRLQRLRINGFVSLDQFKTMLEKSSQI